MLPGTPHLLGLSCENKGCFTAAALLEYDAPTLQPRMFGYRLQLR